MSRLPDVCLLLCWSLLAGVANGQQPAAESVLLRAGAAQVFAALASDDGCMRLFGAAVAAVELRVGGTLRTHHDGKARLGDPGTVVLEVVAVEPERYVGLRLRAPVVAGAEKPPATLGLRLQPLGPDRTRLFVVRHEWHVAAGTGQRLPLGPGNPWTLASLQQAVEPPRDASAPGPVGELLVRLVGGTWMAQRAAGTARLSAQVRVGRVTELEEWRGDGKAPTPFQRIDVFRDPAADVFAFVAWQEEGVAVNGHVRSPERGVLEFAASEPPRVVRRLVLGADGRLVDEGRERLVFERKDAIPEKLR